MPFLYFAFLQPYLGPAIPWFYHESLWWTVFGLTANVAFSGRFILQWLMSEKHKQIVVPPAFWHISFWASLVNLIYGFHIDKLPIIVGFIFLPIVYGRNLVLLKRKEIKTEELEKEEESVISPS